MHRTINVATRAIYGLTASQVAITLFEPTEALLHWQDFGDLRIVQDKRHRHSRRVRPRTYDQAASRLNFLNCVSTVCFATA